MGYKVEYELIHVYFDYLDIFLYDLRKIKKIYPPFVRLFFFWTPLTSLDFIKIGSKKIDCVRKLVSSNRYLKISFLTK